MNRINKSIESDQRYALFFFAVYPVNPVHCINGPYLLWTYSRPNWTGLKHVSFGRSDSA